jgi:hypothetical protein
MNYQIDTETLRKLIQGKYKFFTCLECAGTGSVLVDSDLGIVVVAPHPDKDASSYYNDCCDDCHGLGGRLVFD